VPFSKARSLLRPDARLTLRRASDVCRNQSHGRNAKLERDASVRRFLQIHYQT
jgi:hypothetical protein